MLRIGGVRDATQARALHLRAQNLGIPRWQLWARGRPESLVDDVERRDARCLVVDLGSLSTREEQAVAAEAVLATLWRRRDDASPSSSLSTRHTTSARRSRRAASRSS